MTKRFFHRLFGRGLSFFFPDVCYGCQTFIQGQGLCAECYKQFTFLDSSCCRYCGQPFPVTLSSSSTLQCGSCTLKPMGLDGLVSAFLYNEASRPLIINFKHKGQFLPLDFFINCLLRRKAVVSDSVDYIVPVPLHWTRLLKRGFNQSALLAQNLSRKMHIPYAPTLLKRTVATPSQGALSMKNRHQNVKKAFVVPEKFKLSIAKKHILIIDDVVTTGATLNECAYALKKGGAQKVSALSLALVPRKHFLS